MEANTNKRATMQAAINIQRTVTVKREAVERIVTLQSQRKCLACECVVDDGDRIIRGLCWPCYKATLRAFERGDFSEEDRIKSGKLLEAKKGGRRPSNPVTVEARSS